MESLLPQAKLHYTCRKAGRKLLPIPLLISARKEPTSWLRTHHVQSQESWVHWPQLLLIHTFSVDKNSHAGFVFSNPRQLCFEYIKTTYNKHEQVSGNMCNKRMRTWCVNSHVLTSRSAPCGDHMPVPFFQHKFRSGGIKYQFGNVPRNSWNC